MSREDLGEEEMDAGTIERLAERIEVSHAQEASVEREEREPPTLTRGAELERERDLDVGLEL